MKARTFSTEHTESTEKDGLMGIGMKPVMKSAASYAPSPWQGAGGRDTLTVRSRGPLTILPLLALFLLTACASNPIPIDPAPYAGPDLRIEAGERNHIAVFTMPTGGWGLTFDRTRERFDARQVFITLKRPDPTQAVTQAVVDQRADTRTRLSSNVEVFARITEKDSPNPPYRLAGRAEKR